MEKKVFSVEEYAKKARQAVAEGIVLLKNDEELLPLPAGSRVALFGRSQFCYYKSGMGSGGMVNTSYVTGIKEALERDGRFVLNTSLQKVYEDWLKEHPFDTGVGWAMEPWFQEEMPVSRELVERVRGESDTAILIIGRTAGEDRDNLTEEGSYLLTKTEEAMLETVCAVFERTIVLLNVGNIIDMKWVQRYQPLAVLYVWQGGQEGGNGVLDVLSGDVSPSGRLADTIAYDITDYPSTPYYGDTFRNLYKEDIYVGYRYFSTFAPEKVLYPFGFGLSYTSFTTESTIAGTFTEGFTAEVRVTNIGKRTGKEVVQIYCQAPQGRLGKASRVLCGFTKTGELAVGESRTYSLRITPDRFASYDDSGVTGNKSCYVLEAGEYCFYAGENVRDAEKIGSFTLDETVVTERLEEVLAPTMAFECMKPGEQKEDGSYEMVWQQAALRTVNSAQRREERLPAERSCTGDQGYRLADVENGQIPMEDFIAQLTDEELCCIVRMEGMCSPKVTPGTAGAFGGVTESLLHYGIPLGCCADGPSGIRLDCGTIAFSMPNGTCLACSFNEELSEELYAWEGLELRKNKIETLLGPGMNLHRNPLNGRNFEYFSEDPLLTGRMAAAQLRGMHKYQVTGTIKHFACNNQEHSRNLAEAVVSERALRELYLKGFEIAVKEGQARSVMSTYGPVNGFWTAGCYDLLTTILRGDWGFTGIVMTDWWAKANDEGKTAAAQNMAAMVRAQNDLYAVTANAEKNSNADNTLEELGAGRLTRGELQRNAANICRFLTDTPAFLRMTGRETELDRELARYAEQENGEVGTLIKLDMEDEVSIDPARVDTAKGKATTLEVAVKTRGSFRLEITCRAAAEAAALSQLPLSVFQDRQLMGTVTLMGEEKGWQTKVVEFPSQIFLDTFYVKLFFGMSGMEIKELKIVRTGTRSDNE